ncbi:twin-arginine translocase TatA/TatE family subunit [Streptomyces goshikiensis]|uniref:twin-arginine translocase TatA/TatE family subunit n=1 Tax=Streptomyces goshikiensis TaxID=1942 RepID=UPI0033BA9D75
MLENRLLEIIIALVVMVLFGAKRLPDTARSLGRSLRILKAEPRVGSEEAAQEASSMPAEPPVLSWRRSERWGSVGMRGGAVG